MWICLYVCEVLQFLTFLVHTQIKFSIILIVDSMYVCLWICIYEYMSPSLTVSLSAVVSLIALWNTPTKDSEVQAYHRTIRYACPVEESF